MLKTRNTIVFLFQFIFTFEKRTMEKEMVSHHLCTKHTHAKHVDFMLKFRFASR